MEVMTVINLKLVRMRWGGGIKTQVMKTRWEKSKQIWELIQKTERKEKSKKSLRTNKCRKTSLKEKVQRGKINWVGMREIRLKPSNRIGTQLSWRNWEVGSVGGNKEGENWAGGKSGRVLWPPWDGTRPHPCLPLSWCRLSDREGKNPSTLLKLPSNH